MTPTAVHVRILGRVQGVWFRGWTVQQAERRNLNGWVRNRRDGSVEAVLSGPAGQVDELVVLCHRGPPAASVTSVETSPIDIPPDIGFRQLPTA